MCCCTAASVHVVCCYGPSLPGSSNISPVSFMWPPASSLHYLALLNVLTFASQQQHGVQHAMEGPSTTPGVGEEQNTEDASAMRTMCSQPCRSHKLHKVALCPQMQRCCHAGCACRKLHELKHHVHVPAAAPAPAQPPIIIVNNPAPAPAPAAVVAAQPVVVAQPVVAAQPAAAPTPVIVNTYVTVCASSVQPHCTDALH